MRDMLVNLNDHNRNIKNWNYVIYKYDYLSGIDIIKYGVFI